MPEKRSSEIRSPWARSDRFVPRVVLRPVQEFLRASTSSGLILLAAVMAALLWANLGTTYERIWQTSLSVSLGDFRLDGDLRFWVSESLMTIFFLVAGLEIKREVLVGELRGLRRAALPILSALGGMIVPALLFVAVVDGPAERAWGAAMPTDVAVTLGVLALAGRRVPAGLATFLLALALVDDIATIVVLAAFYSAGLSATPLVVAVLAVGAIVVAERSHVRTGVIYVGLGICLWLGLEEGGVHPALAGAILGFLAPVHPFQPPAAVSEEARRTADHTTDHPATPDEDLPAWLRLAWLAREAVAPLARLEHTLVPWSSYVVLPLFVLANVGVTLSGGALAAAAAEPLVPALVLTRLVGKVVGVVGVSWLAVRVGLGHLPEGVGWVHMIGGAVATAIAFTVSLFVVEIALPGTPELVSAAKIAIIASGLVCGGAAIAILRIASPRRPSFGPSG